jgi:hypothetical protein
MRNAVVLLAIAVLILSACAPQAAPTAAVPPPPSETPTPSATPAPTETPTRVIPITGQIWFAPFMYGQPAAPWQEGYGAVDYLDLFSDDAPWETASSRVHVFKAYMYAFDRLNDSQLRRIVTNLNRRGIAIALETQPLSRSGDCGFSEAFAYAGDAVSETLKRLRRFRRLGGEVRFLAMDEPLTFGKLPSPEGCGLSVEQVAWEVFNYVRGVKDEFPDIIIGDIEYSGAGVEDVKDFIEAYYQVSGEYLPFLHWDVDWQERISWWNVDWKQNRFLWPQWPEPAKDLEIYCRERGIRFGMIYNGNLDAFSDMEWLKQAEEHMAMYESLGGKPDHIIFQSWHMYPKHLLPESNPNSFTHLINRYFDIRTMLVLQVDSASSQRALFGKLTDISGEPISGAPVEIWVKPLAGTGILAKYTITGSVPSGAKQAVVGFRVNTECSCNGDSEFYLYEVRYEESDGIQRVPNGDFSQGLQGWSYITKNTVHLLSRDLASGLMLQVRARPEQEATINSARFSVTGGATYTVTFVARVAPSSSVDAGYFGIFFLTGSSELERKMLPIEPAFLTYDILTSPHGDFRLDLSEVQTVPLMIQGKFEGDNTHWPAYTRIKSP